MSTIHEPSKELVRLAIEMIMDAADNNRRPLRWRLTPEAEVQLRASRDREVVQFACDLEDPQVSFFGLSVVIEDGGPDIELVLE